MIWRFQRSISHRLLAWSLISLAAAAILAVRGQAFLNGIALQAALWGVIDAAIALFGLRGLSAKLNHAFDPAASAKDTAALRRLLWINSGLDVLYVSAGLILIFTLGARDPFTRGNGWGVVIQGGFLLLFDLLHALCTPTEIYLPDPGLFTSGGHDPYSLPGSKGTILLVHGFPGTPIEVRALGEHLNRAGWGVEGLLLPGFGKQIHQLFQQRAAVWSQTIAAAVDRARANGGRVILVGFSMGAGLSLPAAIESKPDALVLVSPFWINLNLIGEALLILIGLFLPESFNPFRMIPRARIQQSAELSPPPGHLYPAAPEYFAGMKDVHLPLLFLEQFVELSRGVRKSAARLDCPVFVLQGGQDPIVRPILTRRLVHMLGPRAIYMEIPGEHHIIMPDSPAFSRVADEVLAYIESVRQ